MLVALIALAPLSASGQSGLRDREKYKTTGPQGQSQGGMVDADTSFRVQRYDGSGNLKVAEAFPPTTANFSQQIITDFSIVAAAGCSSNVVNVAGLRHMKLLLKATPVAGVASNMVSLAVQVRTHLNGVSDSSSTFVEYPQAVIITLNSATTTDTLNFGHHSVGSATLPWSGEFVVRSALNRASPGNGVGAVAWSYPNGIAIPLDSMFGRDFWGDYISIRIRNLGTMTCIVNAYLIGTPL
jgi:hypothetical protein